MVDSGILTYQLIKLTLQRIIFGKIIFVMNKCAKVPRPWSNEKKNDDDDDDTEHLGKV